MTSREDFELGQRFVGGFLAAIDGAQADFDLILGDIESDEDKVSGGLIACTYAFAVLARSQRISPQEAGARVRNVVIERAPNPEDILPAVDMLIFAAEPGRVVTVEPHRWPQLGWVLDALVQLLVEAYESTQREIGSKLSLDLANLADQAGT